MPSSRRDTVMNISGYYKVVSWTLYDVSWFEEGFVRVVSALKSSKSFCGRALGHFRPRSYNLPPKT